MENNQNKNSYELGNEDYNGFDVREILEKYLTYWKWFVLSVVLISLIAFIFLNFTRPSFKAISTIQIESDDAADNSTLAVFQDLGVMGGAENKIEDEIEILRSKSLVSEVIKDLRLNVRYYTEKNNISNFLDNTLGMSTEFYNNEVYTDPPIKINFLMSDSLLYKTNSAFVVKIQSNNKYIYKDIESGEEKVYSFGQKIFTPFGELIITPNLNLGENNYLGQNVYVSIYNVIDLTYAYLNSLNVEPKAQFSSIITMSIVDGNRQKAEDFLNTLVEKYNDRAISLKEELSKSTSDFVTQRLQIISDELMNVDLTAESIKTQYQWSDVASETGLNMQSGQEIEKKIVDANIQLETIGSIKNFVSSKGTNELIPVDVGVSDNSVSNSMQQYNELMMEKQRLLKTSTEKNPTVVNINEQLDILKQNITQGLTNLESSQKISLDALTRQDALINSRLYAAPKQERQIRDVQRQQQIKEQLYLYLLQKREETAITLGVRDPNAKVIDLAESLPIPVGPKKKITFLAGLILALIIPAVVLYLIEFLDSKVHTREDVEKILNIPIIGDIPKQEGKGRYLLKREDHSSTAEAFRILRTNLNFIVDSNKKNKVVFITSTIAHEGKSMVASNLAASLAHAGKKTLLMGMDIRAPKIQSYLGVRGVQGVTNFIVNQNLEVDDLIVEHTDIENLHILSSGDLAPNPSELLMSERVKELLESVKKNYEYIIVDTAAFSMVTDTMLISNLADAFIYVIRANFLDKRFLKYVKSLHKEKRLPNLTLLINGVDHKKSYGYGYGYGYGETFEKGRKPWWKLN